MMDQEAFMRLVAEIQAQGYDEASAARYASLIGDTPLLEPDRSVLVMDGRRIVARLKPLKFFSEQHD